MEIDSTIARMRHDEIRRQPHLRAYAASVRVTPAEVLAYSAVAENADGRTRLVACFPTNPFKGGVPKVFALDGETWSLHREGGEVGSAELCLYFHRDPEDRRWVVHLGLVGLFDIARRHLLSEHVWRERMRAGGLGADAPDTLKHQLWPTEDAPHGDLARPVRAQPDKQIPDLRRRTVLDAT